MLIHGCCRRGKLTLHCLDTQASYGAAASGMTIFSATVGTSLAALWVHNTIIGSGVQPTTICNEYKAAEISMNVSAAHSVVEHVF